MTNNINIISYHFGKGAEIHECGEAPALLHDRIGNILQHCHMGYRWIEAVPLQYQVASSNDEFGYKPHTIKNKTAVIGAVTSLAEQVALSMITTNTMVFVVGGDHTQGLGTNKGLVLAETIKAMLSGELPLLKEKDNHLKHLKELIKQGNIASLAEFVGQLVQKNVDQHTLERFLSSFYLIWFDAHGDYNTVETTPSGNAHGMAAAAISGEGDTSLTGIIGNWAKLLPENMHFVAVCDLDKKEEQFMREKQVHIHGMDAIGRYGLKQVLADILTKIERESLHKSGVPAKLHLSFDIDGIDAKYVPATGTPVGEGSLRNPSPGPSLAETIEAFRGILHKVKVIDLAESNFHPNRDPENITLHSVSEVITGFFCGD